MIIERLKLNNWRNYHMGEYRWDPRINLIYGDNAQGKTNLLEAISYLGLASSFRAAADIDLINKEKEYFYLEADIQSVQQGSIAISAAMNKNKQRKWSINNQPRQKLVDIIGIFHSVVFSPEDIYLIKGGPELRRRWLNRQISQIDSNYCKMLLNYNHVLKQRNACLKNWEKNPDEDTLKVWDKQLIDYGSKISAKRQAVLLSLTPMAEELHGELTNGEILDLQYISSIVGKENNVDSKQLAEHFLAELKRQAQSERYRGSTLVGPHRDEIKISVDNTLAREFASQGQQRSIAISLKLAELELANIQRGEYPVLLLDDVLSELDYQRKKKILALPDKAQTFITAAGEDIQINQGKKWLVEKVDNIAKITG